MVQTGGHVKDEVVTRLDVARKLEITEITAHVIIPDGHTFARAMRWLRIAMFAALFLN